MNKTDPGATSSAAAQGMQGAPMLTAQEVHDFLAGIDTSTLAGLRNRAVIGLLACAGCSPAAVARLRLGDLLVHDGQLQVRLRTREDEHEAPCEPLVQAWLQAYLDRAELSDPDAPLFRMGGMRADALSRRPMTQREMFSMVHDRAEAAGVRARLPWSAFRASGLSLYLANGAWTQPA